MKTKKLLLKIALAFFALIIVIPLTYCASCYFRYKSIENTNLPKIEINTVNNTKIVSKTEYLSCTVSINGTSDEYCIDNVSANIRGRGNDTWKYYPKKPYRIKFDEKISLFGESEKSLYIAISTQLLFSLSPNKDIFSSNFMRYGFLG